MDVPKIVPVDLSRTLTEASKSHTAIGQVIAQHAATATETRRTEHDRLAAENRLGDATLAIGG